MGSNSNEIKMTLKGTYNAMSFSLPSCNARRAKASNSSKLWSRKQCSAFGVEAMSFSSRIFPCHMPKVKISTPKSLRAAAMGLGSPPLEYPSVIRNITFVAFSLEWRRICCNRSKKIVWVCIVLVHHVHLYLCKTVLANIICISKL